MRTALTASNLKMHSMQTQTSCSWICVEIVLKLCQWICSLNCSISRVCLFPKIRLKCRPACRSSSPIQSNLFDWTAAICRQSTRKPSPSFPVCKLWICLTITSLRCPPTLSQQMRIWKVYLRSIIEWKVSQSQSSNHRRSLASCAWMATHSAWAERNMNNSDRNTES